MGVVVVLLDTLVELLLTIVETQIWGGYVTALDETKEGGWGHETKPLRVMGALGVDSDDPDSTDDNQRNEQEGSIGGHLLMSQTKVTS